MLRRLTIGLALATLCAGARADTLVLANGDTLSGEILEWAVDYVVIDHPQLGPVRLSLDQLEIDTGTPPRRGLFGTRFLRGWKRHIDLGVNGQQSNNKTGNITAGLELSYADEFKRWRMFGRYFFNRGDEGVEDNNGWLELRRDWLVPGSPLFLFSSLRYQYDDFESWQNRTTLSLGPGYKLVNREDHSLDVRLGGSWAREFAGDRENRGEMLLGFDYSWTIAENHSFGLSNDLFLEMLPDAGQYRIVTRGEWRIRLARETGLSLLIGAVNEYESDVPEEDENNSLRYYLALGLDF